MAHAVKHGEIQNRTKTENYKRINRNRQENEIDWSTEGGEKRSRGTLQCLLRQTHSNARCPQSLAEISVLQPQSCKKKTTPPHCADPHHGQPCTDINKQTHTYTRAHRQNLTSDRLVKRVVCRALFHLNVRRLDEIAPAIQIASFGERQSEEKGMSGTKLPPPKKKRKRGRKARRKMEIREDAGQKEG